MTESHEKYLIEQIKNDPELAREYAKAQCDTKEYVEIIARLRLLVAELKEDGERLYNWTHNHYALTELENEKQDAEICADMDSHRSLRAKCERLQEENEGIRFELRRINDFVNAMTEIKKAGCDFRLESDTSGNGEYIFTMTIVEPNNTGMGTGWSVKHQSTQNDIFDAVYLARTALESEEK